MNITYLARRFISLFLGATLLVFVGCGSDSGGAAIDSAEVSQLSAKAAQGDGDAAMKLGEMYANKVGDREAQMEAAKWFHLAGRLGNDSATTGINAVTAQMSLEDQDEVLRRVEAFKLPAK